MCQLNPGLFFNITDTDPKEFEERIGFKDESSDDIKLTMSWIDAGYIRIQFEVEGKSILHSIWILGTISNENFRSNAV